MTTFLLIVIVGLLIGILCRLDPRFGALVRRGLRISRISLYILLGLLGISVLAYVLAPYFSSVIDRLNGEERADRWAIIGSLVGFFFILLFLIWHRLRTRQQCKQAAMSGDDATVVIGLGFLGYLLLFLSGLLAAGSSLKAHPDPNLGWELTGAVVLACLASLSFTQKEVSRYRHCHAQGRTITNFIRNCCCRSRCRLNSFRSTDYKEWGLGADGECAACRVCHKYDHATFDHPSPPTEELAPQKREITDAEAQAIAQRFEALAYANPELRKGMDIAEGEDMLGATGRLVAHRHPGLAARVLGRSFSGGWDFPKNEAEAIRWYRVGVERGDSLSAFFVGWMYEGGSGGLAKDFEKAFRWFRYAGKLAIENNDSAAMYELGGLYSGYKYLWPSIDVAYREGFEWYGRAAVLGHPKSMVEVGLCYEEGRGTSQDYTKAAEWYRKAAEQGESDGNAFLAKCYEEGLGVPQDYVKAYAWLLRSRSFVNRRKSMSRLADKMTPEQLAEAEQFASQFILPKLALAGDKDAQWELGCLYRENGKTVEAIEWIGRAAGNGHGQARSDLIHRLINPKYAQEQIEATKSLKVLAEQGDPEAAWWVGRSYWMGLAVDKDSAEAVRLWRIGATKGDLLSAVWLGRMYNQGEGVSQAPSESRRLFQYAAKHAIDEHESGIMAQLGDAYEHGLLRDLAESFKWHALAAEAGDANSMLVVAECYHEGLVVEKDSSKMAEWYRRAAEQGDEWAKRCLGLFFAEGLGVRKDYVQAYAWLKRSTVVLKEERTSLAAKMTSEQIAEAERQAEQWNPTWASIFRAKLKQINPDFAQDASEDGSVGKDNL